MWTDEFKYGGDCMCGFIVFVDAKVVKVGARGQ